MYIFLLLFEGRVGCLDRCRCPSPRGQPRSAQMFGGFEQSNKPKKTWWQRNHEYTIVLVSFFLVGIATIICAYCQPSSKYNQSVTEHLTMRIESVAV